MAFTIGPSGITVDVPLSVANGGTAAITAAAARASLGAGQDIQLQTAVATTSGTSIDFTGIPSGVKRVTMMFNGVSTSGGSVVLIQLGTSSGIDAAGYTATGAAIIGSTGTVDSSIGFPFGNSNDAAGAMHRNAVLTHMGGNVWEIHGGMRQVTLRVGLSVGGKTLSNILDRVRLTSTTPDTFDAGSVSISWEF